MNPDEKMLAADVASMTEGPVAEKASEIPDEIEMLGWPRCLAAVPDDLLELI